jgi:hypothetical protein
MKIWKIIPQQKGGKEEKEKRLTPRNLHGVKEEAAWCCKRRKGSQRKNKMSQKREVPRKQKRKGKGN